jgi:hypothetical protein
MSKNQDIVMTPDTARRVASAVRWVEQWVKGGTSERSQPRITRPSRFAITSSTITAGNQTTKKLGFGTGTLQLITPAFVSGAWTYPYAAIPGQPDVVLLNGGASIATGRLVQGKVIDDFFVIDVDYCP